MENRLNGLPYIAATSLDISYCRSAHLVRLRRDGRYNLMIHNQVVRSIILPNPTLTDAKIMANWTFYLDAPAPDGAISEEQPNAEPDEVEEAMEQDQPTEGVQPPPTQDPSSSRRRRRADPYPITN